MTRTQPTTKPLKPGVPLKILAKLRAICLRLPDAYEESAWVGTRWMIRKRNFAHVVRIADGWPAAYARAASSNGPLVVLTFRATDILRDALRDVGSRFFVPAWGTRWGTKVMGLKLDEAVDWKEVEAVLAESHRLLAPKASTRAPRTAARTPARKVRKRRAS
ncbi:MAG TPA: MmcQ/YjbR family DNA-binding protein [Polyangiales bacterium]|nr:MmcQ/YjbR family DNA-binding protein [Polyangiales bacterium]